MKNSPETHGARRSRRSEDRSRRWRPSRSSRASFIGINAGSRQTHSAPRRKMRGYSRGTFTYRLMLGRSFNTQNTRTAKHLSSSGRRAQTEMVLYPARLLSKISEVPRSKSLRNSTGGRAIRMEGEVLIVSSPWTLFPPPQFDLYMLI